MSEHWKRLASKAAAILLLLATTAAGQTYPQVDASAIYVGGPGDELRITKSGSRVTIAGAPIVVEPGSTGITTVGTITTGTWNAGAVTSSGLITTSAGLRVNDGSAAAPSLAFASDTDTGIYRAAGDNIAVATGGTTRWAQSGSSFRLSSSTQFGWSSGSGDGTAYDLVLARSAAGVLQLHNNAGGFGRLQFGGTTSGFPALKRNGAALDVRLADDSGYANLAAANLTANGSLIASQVASHLVPSATDTYDLGSASRLWRNSFISTMNALVFAKTTQTLLGGYSTIGKNAGDVAADVASAETTVNFGQTMTPGDFVLIRAHDTGGVIKTEYLQVGSLVSGTTYNVTRDLAGSHATDPAWAAGTPYLVLGQSGDGRIDLIAADSKPRMVVTTQGSTFNAQNDRAVVGNLNTYYGYTSDIIGAASAIRRARISRSIRRTAFAFGRGRAPSLVLMPAGTFRSQAIWRWARAGRSVPGRRAIRRARAGGWTTTPGRRVSAWAILAAIRSRGMARR